MWTNIGYWGKSLEASTSMCVEGATDYQGTIKTGSGLCELWLDRSESENWNSNSYRNLNIANKRNIYLPVVLENCINSAFPGWEDECGQWTL
jgi:hypothetical protein